MTQAASDATIARLDELLAAGLMDQASHDTAVAAIRAQLAGSGAVAQGERAMAAGERAVVIRGDSHGIVNTGLLIQLAARPGASADDLRSAYLARLLQQGDQLPLFAGDNAGAQLRLSSVYTALLTRRSDADTATTQGRSRRRAQAATPAGEADQKPLSALDVLDAERKLVLLGGPGSGKSTFVNFVAMAMAGEMLGAGRPNLATLTAPVPREEGVFLPNESEPEPQHWDHGALLPVQVVLRDLAAQLPPPGQRAPQDGDAVWNFILGRLRQLSLDDYAPHLRAELLSPRGGLVLLDGLDEVPDALARREQVKRAVQDFAATFGNCRFLVTSRTYAYQRQDWKLDGFAEVELLPFTRPQIDRFIEAWYAHMVEIGRLGEAAARDRAELLKREVARSERIRELAERPLLLTLVAQLQTRAGGALPEKREELYDKAVEMLLDTWEGTKPRPRGDGGAEPEPSLAEYLVADREGIRRQLNRLAYEAHRDQPQLAGTADIAQRRLTDALLDASANRADVKVRRLEEYLRDRAGILAAHGEGYYQFPHRSFQEYLAACHLTDDDFPDRLAALVREDANRWREVALLAGAKAARGSPFSAWVLAETLCPAAPPQGAAAGADHWGALLAGRVLVECADLARVAPRDAAKRERVRDWQLAIMRRNTLPAVERALAGRTLAVLGDPRPEATTLDGMHFCLVPPGPFLMGDDRGGSDEKPEHVVGLAYPYFMGRFPVTVAQWREYLREAGRLPAEGDDDAGQSLRGRDNDPVVHVSWHDAIAFCAALTRRWRALLPPGFEVVLPSEAEWEKAARGGERIVADPEWLTVDRVSARLAAAGAVARMMRNPFPRRAYPWGNEYDADKANAGAAIGETSAAGCYPTGFGPCGCEDMSGNVCEWTRSLWGGDFFKPEFGYPYRPDDQARENLGATDDVLRVVRGGAFGGSAVNARCAYRYGLDPGNRFNDLGFRAVLRSAPVFQLRTP